MYDKYKGKIVTIMGCFDCNVRCKHCYSLNKWIFLSKELREMVKILKTEI